MIRKLDDLFRAVFRAPLKLLCNTTGRSNFALAIVPLWLMEAAVIATFVLYMLQGVYSGVLFHLLMAGSVAWLCVQGTQELLDDDSSFMQDEVILLSLLASNARQEISAPVRVGLLGFWAATLAMYFVLPDGTGYGVVLTGTAGGMFSICLYWASEYIPSRGAAWNRK